MLRQRKGRMGGETLRDKDQSWEYYECKEWSEEQGQRGAGKQNSEEREKNSEEKIMKHETIKEQQGSVKGNTKEGEGNGVDGGEN